MELNNIDISKLPADVRKTFKQMQVLLAEKKIQSKAKNDFLSFVKCVWPEFVEGSQTKSQLQVVSRPIPPLYTKGVPLL